MSAAVIHCVKFAVDIAHQNAFTVGSIHTFGFAGFDFVYTAYIELELFMDTSNQKVWIMGCGDIGRRVARLYQNEGTKAIGWVRSEESLQLGLAQRFSHAQR